MSPVQTISYQGILEVFFDPSAHHGGKYGEVLSKEDFVFS